MDTMVERFRALHRPGQPLLMANAWDVGSALLLASLGFEALATTSSGHAATLGRLDGDLARDEALAHAAGLVAATELPVSADLENGYADDPEGVAETVRRAVACGLAGCSIEDATGRSDDPIYDAALATERVAAAAEAAGGRLVLTARAENHLYAREDLDDTIARLRSFAQAGADVVYAPGLSRLEDVRAVVEAVDRPVNVLAYPGLPRSCASPASAAAMPGRAGAPTSCASWACVAHGRSRSPGGPRSASASTRPPAPRPCRRAGCQPGGRCGSSFADAAATGRHGPGPSEFGCRG